MADDKNLEKCRVGAFTLFHAPKEKKANIDTLKCLAVVVEIILENMCISQLPHLLLAETCISLTDPSLFLEVSQAQKKNPEFCLDMTRLREKRSCLRKYATLAESLHDRPRSARVCWNRLNEYSRALQGVEIRLALLER